MTPSLPPLSPVLRIWLGFASLGAGLIHLALVIGAPPALATAFALLGAAEFAWGTFCFARDEPPLQRLALLFVLLPLLGWIGLLLVAAAVHSTELTRALPALPLAISTLLDTVVAVALGMRMRARRRLDGVRPNPGLPTAAEAEADPDPDAGQRSSGDPGTPHPVPESSPAQTVRFLLGVALGALIIAALTTTGLSATEAGQFPSVHELNLPGLHLH
ncbi:hypothetical protein [Schumannella soli]|uniref:Uncharacterized protein n=1 Tax=Schumannella soli TaxID=2590779 RepID=A0A506YB91_9MICO|nr:hypothetical protein [Schumannella soli]TPW77739.1 hypothetical protein FJ657_03555 [Schumannella soli]